MVNVEAWFRAFRLRTLPLSFSCIILGSLLALWKGSFYVEILVGALVTTLFLQVLSNLANDYGDFKNGLDYFPRSHAERMEPDDLLVRLNRWQLRPPIFLY